MAAPSPQFVGRLGGYHAAQAMYPKSNDATPEDREQGARLERWQREGDVDALDALLRTEVLAIAARLRKRGGGLIGASASAGDLAQEAVMHLLDLEQQPHFETPAGLRAYLWTAAWHLLLRHAERPGRRVYRLDRESSSSLTNALSTTGGLSRVDGGDMHRSLQVVVNLLHAEDRDVLTQVYFEGLPVDECARRLGLSKPAVEMRLTRARRRLLERVASWAEVIR